MLPATFTLNRLPEKVKTLRIYVTEKNREMQVGQRISIAKRQAKFKLDSSRYTTLINE